ncbi:pentatricopeptide repeat-containing protein At5g15300 [Tripterygium wilfordii]|uniref:pentatricopeptide repeat-containing protein At5g15300 n=1 Tax=Tripterygium wilfordii TaxID=458696 RepID=UPI0018F82138|nr:pentatricopeptide repeat-containing protein At5g15300 [Tripterygium wilfordii]XP_038724658.1 pentatricopeptide repeat-containing protein At5g15300 [Tripterygium wilfordii]XP_038724659.1 pentatricopeptide repeat-containing protein At5g15300 [Tripterygium wilfordii]
MIKKRQGQEDANCRQRSSLWRNCKNLRSLKQIHASLVVNGFNSSYSALRELIFSAAIDLPGTIYYAHQLFVEIAEPDTFMWNTMIRGSAQSQSPWKAVSLYSQMENRRQMKPDNFTFAFLLKACTRLSWRNIGLGIHGRVTRYGFEADTFVRNTLIYFHANCGDLDVATALFADSAKRDVIPWSALTAGYARRGELGLARKLFNEMPMKDLVSWNVMITAYVKQGEMGSARELFDNIPERDVVTWNAMIAGYVSCGSCELALEMFEEMRRVGQQPDQVTMLSLLSACADLGDLDVGRKIHFALLEISSGDFSILLGNALIDMYAKCGSISQAMEVFHEMAEKDVSTWNSAIGGLAFHGHAEDSLSLFTKMQISKTMPNEITFVAVLVACSHTGQVEEGRRYFKQMRDGYNIEPNIKHYGCMVDMLGRAGLLNEAFEMIDSMDIESNAIIWRTLLGACRIHGNVELGRLANERLLNMRRDESGDYVLLSNIYASQSEWHGVEKVRKLMDDSGVRKGPGCSLVEADEKALMHFLFESKPKKNARNHAS